MTRSKTETLAIKISSEEMIEIDRTWKRMDNIPNRSQFVKLAINSYSGEDICKTRINIRVK